MPVFVANGTGVILAEGSGSRLGELRLPRAASPEFAFNRMAAGRIPVQASPVFRC